VARKRNSALISKKRKNNNLYKVKDSDGTWVTLSIKSNGPLVKKTITGGKIYPSIASFQRRLRQFIRFSERSGIGIKYGSLVLSPSQFIEVTLNWKVIPFSQGHEIDMTFLMDSYKNETV